jgi:hypothetical protein
MQISSSEQNTRKSTFQPHTWSALRMYLSDAITVVLFDFCEELVI